MKGILALCAATFVLLVGLALTYLWQQERYGETSPAALPVSVSQLVMQPQDYAGKVVRVEGKITGQCRATGCFFYFATGGKKIKIELGQILTTLGRREGKRALVEGEVVSYEDTFQIVASSIEIR